MKGARGAIVVLHPGPVRPRFFRLSSLKIWLWGAYPWIYDYLFIGNLCDILGCGSAYDPYQRVIELYEDNNRYNHIIILYYNSTTLLVDTNSVWLYIYECVQYDNYCVILIIPIRIPKPLIIMTGDGTYVRRRQFESL